MSDPLENLALTVTADTYAALAPILTSLAQHLNENESALTALQAEGSYAEHISNALQFSLSNASFQLPTVPVAPATTTTSACPHSLHVDLPKFHGTLKESVWAFLSIIQDHLEASYIPKDDWELKAQYDSPTHADEICGALHKIQYHGNITDYILHFQNLEMQLDDKEMTFGDRRHYFTHPLPPDLGFHISNLSPKTMSEVYNITHNWAHHKRFAQAGHKTDHIGEQRPAKPVPPIAFPSSSAASTSTAMPVPMDLNSFEPRTKAPPTGPRSHQDMTKVRCYNCNRMGHYSKNCRLPRNPTSNANRNNATLNGQAKCNYPHSASQSMFHFGDPQPIRPHCACDAAQPYPPQTLLQELDKESRRHIRFTQKDVDKFLESCEPAKLNDRPPPPPLDLHLLNLDDKVSEGLPVYHTSVQGHCKFLGRKAKPVLVETILDMAAPDNYLRHSVAEAAHMDIFWLQVPKDIAGAGYTTTVAFAKFTLQIGDIKDTTLAYILEEDSGFSDLPDLRDVEDSDDEDEEVNEEDYDMPAWHTPPKIAYKIHFYLTTISKKPAPIAQATQSTWYGQIQLSQQAPIGDLQILQVIDRPGSRG
ncbi:hypothetical protein EDD85DRAFT_785250 [Armillaria nabsnona]|nr:hypothetical protein EDD85DRAFT_785250 [Armillaria nabsnona]